MATYTSHLNLKLPDYSDTADIKDLNDNFKKIDDAIASGGTGGGTGGGIVTETDPTVPAWAKAANKPTYTADEVGALPSTYEPPVKSVNGKTGEVALVASDVGALPNTTVIPTVPTALKNPYPITINGVAYDGSEAKTITIQAADGGESVSLDTTLTQYGMAADAGATGNAIAQEKAAREEAVNELNEAIANKAALSGNVLIFKNGDSDLFSVDLSSLAGSSASSIDWTEGY